MRIQVTEPGGSTEIDEAVPGQSYDVHVFYNRDMDASVSPTVSWDGAYPFTTHMVTDGHWVSPREWVGTAAVSALTSGRMIFRTVGGRAADDPWLVCGVDDMRFQFTVNASYVQSLNLSAVPAAGKVELSWQQNEYEILAGYNLYRAAGGSKQFIRLNDTILTDTSYTDADVESGQTYSYYFTLVNTDGGEVEKLRSNTVSASPRDSLPPVITHTPVTVGTPGQAVTISAGVSDNIAVGGVTLYYRPASAAEYTSTNMTYVSATGLYTARVPASAVTEYNTHYYIEAADTEGNIARDGTPDAPHRITAGNPPVLTGVTLSRRTGNVSVSALSELPGSYQLVVAAYDKTGRILAVNVRNAAFFGAEETFALTLPNCTAAETVKAFLLTGQFVPLASSPPGILTD